MTVNMGAKTYEMSRKQAKLSLERLRNLLIATYTALKKVIW